MRGFASITLSVVLGAGVAGFGLAGDEGDRALPTSNQRVVVFENFMSPTCEGCQDAGYYVDLLATDYVGRPVVFVEQNVSTPIGTRWDRFIAAAGNATTIPIAMVDSGSQIHSGGASLDYEATYKKLVEAELVRPPEGDVEVFHRRIDNSIRLYIRIRNKTSDTLDYNNAAALSALVWEDKRVATTSRYVRSAPFVGIEPALPPGGEASYVLNTDTLNDVVWDKLHAVAFVDYRPDPKKPYNMLQAAISQAAGFYVSPKALQVNIDADNPQFATTEISLAGPFPLTWNATIHGNWLTLDQMSGTIDSKPKLSLAIDKLTHGWQEGSVEMIATSTDGMSYTTSLPIKVYYGARTLRVETCSGQPGGTATLPISVESIGSESRFDFSIAYNPAVFASPRVTLTTASNGAALLVDQTQTAQGRLGVSLVLPAGKALSAGIIPIATISLAVAPGTLWPSQSVQFTDRPLPRLVTDGAGAELYTRWQDGTVTISEAQGPRPRRHFGR